MYEVLFIDLNFGGEHGVLCETYDQALEEASSFAWSDISVIISKFEDGTWGKVA